MEWKWGLAGENTWSRFSTKDQKEIGLPPQTYTEGPVRVVEGIEEYVVPGDLPESVPCWVFVGVGERGRKRYVMPLPDPNPESASDLFKLGHKLRKYAMEGRFNPVNPEDGEAARRELLELDQIVDRLLERVDLLHRRGSSIGVLAPPSICWYRPLNNEPIIIMPDLGFGWSGVGHLPSWLADKGDWKPLWEAAPHTLITDDVDKDRDIRTITRILNWTLSGEIARDIRKPADGRDIRRSPTYAILYAAMNGKYKSIDVLRGALQEAGARPSNHFLFEIYVPPPPPPKPLPLKRILLMATVSVAIVAAGIFGYQELMNGPPEMRSIICPECPPTSKLFALMLQYDATKDPVEQTKLFLAMRSAEASENPTVQEVERKCIDKIEAALLPATGCPLGSELLAILTELEKNLAQFEKSVRDWEAKPDKVSKDAPFVTPKELNEWLSASEQLMKLPRLPSEISLGKREDDCVKAVLDRMVKTFEWNGEHFGDHYDGDPNSIREFGRFKSDWSRFLRLTPIPEHKENHPWSDRTERDYSQP